MQRINDDIKKGQFHNVYLLYGQEDYLRKQYRDKLKEALTGGDYSMNYSYFEGNGIQAGELIDLAETLPFFSERRVIVVENSGWFKSGEERIAGYLSEVCPTTFFVFVEKEIEKKTKTFKAAGANGLAVEFSTMDEDMLLRWVAGKIQKEGKKITGNDARFFLEKTGTDMSNINTELEKLFCYCLNKEVITAEDIDAICTRNITDQIFDMINAMADKKQEKAMNLYYDLLALKVQPQKILSLISRQFNILLQVKILKSQGMDNRAIGERIGLPHFIVSKYIPQATKMKTDYIKDALKECLQADEAFKTGRMNDRLSVEILLVKFSS